MKPVRVAVLHYSHRHGDDLIPVVLKEGLPRITNKLLSKLGVWDPELERDDEFARWIGPFDLDKIPTTFGPRDWSPRQMATEDRYLTVLSLFSPQGDLDALPVLTSQLEMKNLPEITEELLADFGVEDFDLDDEDNVAGWIEPVGPIKKLDKV